MKTEKQKFNELKRYSESVGIPVRKVGKQTLHDYAASNPEFYKITKVGGKDIEINKAQPVGTQVESLRHEIIETPLMKSGQSYAEAHETALKLEKVDLPPKSLEALRKVGPYKVEHIHDDGDLTLKQNGKELVVTTEGKIFESRNGGNHVHIKVEHIRPHTHPHGHRISKVNHHNGLPARKNGKIYHTKIGKGEVMSRHRLGKRCR